METNQTSEWDPILAPNLSVYANVRVHKGMLQIQLAKYNGITITMDEKAIPQLITILQRLTNEVHTNPSGL